MTTAMNASTDLMSMDDNIRRLAKIAATKSALDLVAAFSENSPVDKGGFKSEWDFEEISSINSLVEISVFNRMPYAGVIEEGSVIGKDPWPAAGEKTIESDGRIWSMQAVGGVMAPVLGDEGQYMEKIVNNIRAFVLDDM